MATTLIAVVEILVPVATALLAAASIPARGVVLTLLSAYVLLVAEVTALTLALSPLHAVTRTGLGVGEALVLSVVAGLWWLRGRPVPGVGSARPTLRVVAVNPVFVVFATVVAVALAYELALVLTVPANNWDSLTYHLARVAAWAQHHGIYWIPHAPTARLNEFQPVAEQQILFLFVATHTGALFALPQFVAQLAIVAATYAVARHLQFGLVPAACAALFVATLPLVALEATTSQNDLVAASMPLAATALLLAGGTAAAVLAGVAIGLGLGVKLTTALVLPILVAISLRKERRRWAIPAALGAGAAFFAVGMWGFVLNLVHTGHLLGHGGGRVEQTTSPSWPGSLITLTRVAYRLLDLSGFDGFAGAVATVTGIAGVVLVVGLQVLGHPRQRPGVNALLVGVLLSPIVVLLGADAIRHLVNSLVPDTLEAPNLRSSEDFSAFGPLGAIVLPVCIALAVIPLARRHRHHDRLALAAALPLFLTILALTSRYNPWLSRFVIVPVALTAPLAAPLFRRKAPALAFVAVAAMSLGLVLGRNELKPLHSQFGRPWNLNWAEAAALTFRPAAAAAASDLQRMLPEHACVGVAVAPDDPSYLVYGPSLRHHVVYLPLDHTAATANREALRFVVVDSGTAPAFALAADGWKVRALSGRLKGHPFWSLATRAAQASGRCGA